MKIVLAVALGGALGALGRYWTGALVGQWLGTAFPYGTLIVNVVGCFVMGLLIEASALFWSPSEALRAFIAVGLLGAFTTFSSFSMDFALLMGRGALVPAVTYLLASVLLSIAGLYAGLALIRVVAP
ncbi:MAG: fluoride efflux transporter CrcB [Kiloniellales bacterium]